MTVSTTATSIRYAGDGSTVAFAVPFEFVSGADLNVVVIDADGVASTKTLTTHYTVSGGAGETGTVTMVTAPSSGTTLSIVRDTDPTQSVNYLTNDRFPAEVHEGALDRLTLLVQEVISRFSRSFKLSEFDDTTVSTEVPLLDARAGKFAYWNSDGELVAVDGTPTQPITKYQQDITATADQTVLTLANAYTPGAGMIEVYVNGHLLSSSDYTETSTTTVTLAAALNLGDAVRVLTGDVFNVTVSSGMGLNTEVVTVATEGQTLFTAGTYTPGAYQVAVYVNGARLTNDDITETSATSVTLDPLGDGDEVAVLTP